MMVRNLGTYSGARKYSLDGIYLELNRPRFSVRVHSENNTPTGGTNDKWLGDFLDILVFLLVLLKTRCVTM